MSIGIYKIENKINHNKYIGQSVNIEKRWEYHKYMYTIMTGSKLYTAIRKYGIENFSFEIIEECPVEKLLEREFYWIDYYDSYKHGYNCNPGGTGGTPIPVVQYDLDGNFIKRFDSLINAAASLNLSKHNLSSCCNGKQKSYGGYLWAYEGEKPPKPYLDKRIGHTTSSAARKIKQFNKQNEFIEEYISAHEAARQIGKPKCANHITECCQGKRKTCEGYIWKYSEE